MLLSDSWFGKGSPKHIVWKNLFVRLALAILNRYTIPLEQSTFYWVS